MGYRSKVIFGVKEKHKKEFNKLIVKLGESEMNYDYWNRKVKSVKPRYSDDRYLVWEYDDLKWYDDYEEVKLVMDSVYEWFDRGYGGFSIALGEDGVRHSETGDWWDVVAEEHDISVDIEKI